MCNLCYETLYVAARYGKFYSLRGKQAKCFTRAESGVTQVNNGNSVVCPLFIIINYSNVNVNSIEIIGLYYLSCSASKSCPEKTTTAYERRYTLTKTYLLLQVTSFVFQNRSHYDLALTLCSSFGARNQLWRKGSIYRVVQWEDARSLFQNLWLFSWNQHCSSCH